MRRSFKRPSDDVKKIGEGSADNNSLIKSEESDMPALLKEIMEEEKENAIKNSKLNIMGLVDATASMGSFWSFTRKTIGELVKNMSNYGDIQMNWVAYRDYDLGERLLEASGWTKNPGRLINFLGSIKCMANNTLDEAVEYGLQYAAQDPKVDCVFLVGDYPPHHDTYHLKKLDWKEMCHVLKGHKKKVYSFRVGHHAPTEIYFKQISEITGGAYCHLNSEQDFLAVLQLIIGKNLNEDSFEQIIASLKAAHGGELPSHIDKFSGLLGTGKE